MLDVFDVMDGMLTDDEGGASVDVMDVMDVMDGMLTDDEGGASVDVRDVELLNRNSRHLTPDT